ncbi:MAG: hypothetical protein ACXWWC_04570 [Chitinophagaceae bacterium]
MNYHLPSSSSTNHPFYTFLIRLGLLILLIFFIAFLAFETVSFIRLFEVTAVANPAMNLIK